MTKNRKDNIMNKKIGILTFHASHNCGSIMQSYAMQTILNNLKYDNEIIDFQNYGQRDMYAIFHKKKSLKNFIKNIVSLLNYKRIKKQWFDYEEFLQKKYVLSQRKYYITNDINNISNDYNICICGADQIWNITIPDSDDAYFLPFKDKKIKKIAYAPSFGAKKIQDYSSNYKKYSNYLNDFDYLSIREKNGQKWIKEMIGKNVPIVLDPTLLIDENEYEKIREHSGFKDEYIFYYAPSYSFKLDKFVKKISKKYKLPVIVWNATEYFLKFEYLNGFILPERINPGVYYDLIKNAKLVITTSFHGTIFSSICKKNFWVLKNGGMYENDDRVKTLIDQLSLHDRLIEPIFDKNYDYLCNCDYKNYDIQIKNLRKKSIDYLIKSLGDSNEKK